MELEGGASVVGSLDVAWADGVGRPAAPPAALPDVDGAGDVADAVGKGIVRKREAEGDGLGGSSHAELLGALCRMLGLRGPAPPGMADHSKEQLRETIRAVRAARAGVLLPG